MKSTLYRGTITKSDWVAALVFVVLLAVAAALYVFVLRAGQIERMDNARAEITRLKSEITRAEKIRDTIDQLREEEARFEQVVKDFELRLPSTRETPFLVSVFESMARDEQLRVDVRPGTPRRTRARRPSPTMCGPSAIFTRSSGSSTASSGMSAT
jgi:Tfp pilus assembly protein PilO